LSFPIPANETQRLGVVRALDILDTAPDIAYDEIGELAAQICQCPVAYISIMDDDRLWLKAKYGLPPDLNQCPREISFCATTVCGAEMIVAPDLREDSRFNQIPFVTGEPHFQFYCGIPLVTEEGYALGTLCVLDFEPRQLTFEQAESLRRLSHQVMTQLELRRKLIEFDQTVKELDRAHTDLVAEKARTEELLVNILPVSVAEELKKSGKVHPKYEPSATILFADFKGFTLLAERMEPVALIGLLDQYFTAFDEIVARHGLEKLKTIGDAYMAVAGVPAANRRHPIDTCLAALETSGRHGPHEGAAREDAVGGTRVACRNPYGAGHIGRRRPAEVHLRHLGRCGEHGGAHGGERRFRTDQCLGNRGRQCKTLFELEPRGSIVAKHERAHEMFFLIA